MVYSLIVHLEAKLENVEKVKAKLIEAASVYRKDRETIDWIVLQDEKFKEKFAIIERYEHESSQQYHLSNPYWKTFDPYVKPLLAKEMELHRFNEM